MGRGGRHGQARKFQQENAKGSVNRFEVKGINKKIAKLSIGQLRNMFPECSHLSENELRKMAIKKFNS